MIKKVGGLDLLCINSFASQLRENNYRRWTILISVVVTLVDCKFIIEHAQSPAFPVETGYVSSTGHCYIDFCGSFVLLTTFRAVEHHVRRNHLPPPPPPHYHHHPLTPTTTRPQVPELSQNCFWSFPAWDSL